MLCTLEISIVAPTTLLLKLVELAVHTTYNTTTESQQS
jgi:hypothetical protein